MKYLIRKESFRSHFTKTVDIIYNFLGKIEILKNCIYIYNNLNRQMYCITYYFYDPK